MYKFGDNQISFDDFEQPVGMKMNRDNRWVKKADTIPWNEIELKYAKLFRNKKGNVAKPLRLALGACIIQAEYGYSDEETVLQIQEGPYLQFFCGFSKYVDEPPFDPSLMVYFRKRLTPEILGEINELIVKRAKEKKRKEDSDKDQGSGNNGGESGTEEPKNQGSDENKNQAPAESNAEEPVIEESKDQAENIGTLIVDATCAPSNIRYPRDSDLLNAARKHTENIIDELYPQSMLDSKPRTYRKEAYKSYLSLARSKKPTFKKIRKIIKKQLGYLRRNIASILCLLENGASLNEKEKYLFGTIVQLLDQQTYMYVNRVHKVADRIVSLSQPFLRPIIRGKASAPVEFGAKLDISVSDGWAFLEKYSYNPYNEALFLQDTIENYRKRSGHYPAKVLADKIYRNRDNLAFCKERGIRLNGPALGRPKMGEVRDIKQDFKDEADRVEVERKFSLAKRKCGMGLIMTKLEDTAAHSIALSVLVLNIRKATKMLSDSEGSLLALIFSNFKIVFVQ